MTRNVTRFRAVTGRHAVNLIPEQMALMHLPWMVLTGYEIAGNVAVSVTFLTSPGFIRLDRRAMKMVIKCIIFRISLSNRSHLHHQNDHPQVGLCKSDQKTDDILHRAT